MEEEIRTPRGKVVKIAVIAGIFVVVGICLVLGGGVQSIALGVIVIVFFGGAGAVALVKLLRHGGVVLCLTPKGIELRTAGGLVPWQDIEDVGAGILQAGSARVRVLGLRVRDPRRYAASLTPGRVRAMRASNLVSVPLGGSGPGGTPAEQMAKAMEFSRQRSGWDLTIPQSTLPGKAEDVVRQIDDYARRLHGG